MSQYSLSPWPQRWAILSLIVTILLTIGIGGVITSTEVGMAYPTWPDINGGSLFDFFYGSLAEQFGIGSTIEHTHRQAGTLSGLAIMALVAACFFSRGTTSTHKKMSLIVFGLVVAQGLLGAFRVLANSYGGAIIHAVGAQLVIVSIVIIIKMTARNQSSIPNNSAMNRLQLWSFIGIIVLFLNLVTAAALRHKEGAFSGHLILAILAAAVLGFVVRHALIHFRDIHAIRQSARRLLTLLGLQLGLGLGTWSYLLGPLQGTILEGQSRFLLESSLATTHLLFGVLVLAQLTALWMDARASNHSNAAAKEL